MRSKKSRLIIGLAMIILVFSAFMVAPATNKVHADSNKKYFLFLQGINSSSDTTYVWGRIKATLQSVWSTNDGNVYQDYSYTGLSRNGQNGYYGASFPETQSLGIDASMVSTYMVCSQIQDKDVYLIGHSLGGVVASYWAATGFPLLALNCPGHNQPVLKGIITIDSPLNGVDTNDVPASCYNNFLQEAEQFVVSKGQSFTALGAIEHNTDVINKIQSKDWLNNTAVLSIKNTQDCFISDDDSKLPGSTPFFKAYGGNIDLTSADTHNIPVWDTGSTPFMTSLEIISWINSQYASGNPTSTPTPTSGSGGTNPTPTPSGGGSGGTTPPTDGIQICSGANGTGSCSNFTYTGDNSTVQSLGNLEHNQDSLKFFGSYVNAYDIVFCLTSNCSSSDREVMHDDPNFASSITQNQYVAIRIVKLPPPQQNCDPGQWEVALYNSDGYKGTCHKFGLGQVNDLSSFGLSGNVMSFKIGTGTNLFVNSEINRSGNPGNFTTSQNDLTGNYWANRIKSISVEEIRDTSCNVDQATANGILLIRDGAYSLNGGCKLITTDSTGLNDLAQSTWDKFTGIKFLGTYKLHYKLSLFTDANYGGQCGVDVWRDESWITDAQCADGTSDSLQVSPFTPPSQAANLAPWATTDRTGTTAAVDGDLNTTWSGNNHGILGFVWNSPQTIQNITVFDSLNSSENQGLFDILFSDGTVLTRVDPVSAGAECAEVTIPSKTVSWVEIIPKDAPQTTGYREVQIFQAGGTPYSTTECPNRYSVTPVTNTTLDPLPLGQETPANCVPGNNQVALFTGRNYSGQCSVIGIGSYPTALSAGIPNDSLWSVKLGTGVKASLWWDDNFSGSQHFFNSDVPDLVSSGDQQIMSSFRVESTAIDPNAPWYMCAEEGGGSCLVPGNTTGYVRYGANGTYVYREVTGSMDCTNIAFGGDPLSGVHKHCDYLNMMQPVFAAEYYNNQTLSGNPTLIRPDASVNFDWGGGSPDGSIPSDHFSARWTQAVTLSHGVYTFNFSIDDGVRFYIDNQLVLDQWIEGTHYYTITPTITTGSHVFKMEYYENGGNAVAKVDYQLTQAIADPIPTPLPTPVPTPEPTATPSPTPSPTPTPSVGTELLTNVWNLAGSNGANEMYQGVSKNALNGMDTVRITYNLHGLQALPGDASAVIFDQNGWHYVSLSNYGQNGKDGSQTVDIPLSDFGLNMSQPLDGTLHTRFWYNSAFTVDITSVKVLNKNGVVVTPTPTPVPSPTPGPSPTPTPTPKPSPKVFENFSNGKNGWVFTNSVVNTKDGTNGILRFTNPSKVTTAVKAVNTTALSSYNTITIKINLHGATLPSGSSAQFFLDQNGIKYVPLSTYVKQKVNGWQTVTVPLSAFKGFTNTKSFARLGISMTTGTKMTIDFDDITFIYR